MSLDSFKSFLTITGLELLKNAHAKYKGTAHFRFGFDYKLYKNSIEGDPKLIKPIAKQIDLKVF